MEAWITSVMNELGYFGVFVLITLENLFPPIPSELILTFGGFMTTITQMNLLLVIVAATFGSVLGAVLLYSISLYFGKERIKRIVAKYGKILRLKETDIDKADAFFARYGGRSVFFCRMIPLIRSLISIPAGMARMPFRSFLTLTTLGSLIWNTILIGLGALLGESFGKAAAAIDSFSTIIYWGIGISVAVLLGLFIKKRRRQEARDE
ncbi:DedA family protein [Listeria kieliensis]|uniref:Alkaline phosphatase n=1 Tax=Listeria kieliensis TaxID=1621700 RepID=A0A3D8TU87_9LIST|nr:DedA family protein [Listeria kieliensis]RDX02445.1 alkaline phosphatase [Listeria kieliensis]